jgi:hypothetical protein
VEVDRPLQRHDTGDRARLDIVGIMITSIDAFLPVSSTSFSRGNVSAGGWYDDSELRPQQLLNEHKITLNRLELLAMTLTAGKDWYGFPVKNPALHLADYSKCLSREGLWWSLSLFSTRTSEKCTGEAIITVSQLEQLAVNGHTDRFLDAAATSCKGRKLFLTPSGHPGLGPAGMLSGDFICVLHGANVPFALRQQGQSWALVGECYAFNQMRGEALDEVSKRGSRLQQGWIEIR